MLLGHWAVRRDRSVITIWCIVLFFLSGALGVMAMDGLVPGEDIWKGMEGNMLMPLFTGLFGLPLLIGSSSGRMPAQDAEPGEPPSVVGALKGSFMGGLVGFLPGVTATAGAVLTTMVHRSREDGPEGFISTVSSVATAASVLGLGTLLLIGKGRSGTLLAMQEAMPSIDVGSLPSLLLCVMISSLLSYVMTMRLGAKLLRQAQRSGPHPHEPGRARGHGDTVLLPGRTGRPAPADTVHIGRHGTGKGGREQSAPHWMPAASDPALLLRPVPALMRSLQP